MSIDKTAPFASESEQLRILIGRFSLLSSRLPEDVPESDITIPYSVLNEFLINPSASGKEWIRHLDYFISRLKKLHSDLQKKWGDALSVPYAELQDLEKNIRNLLQHFSSSPPSPLPLFSVTPEDKQHETEMLVIQKKLNSDQFFLSFLEKIKFIGATLLSKNIFISHAWPMKEPELAHLFGPVDTNSIQFVELLHEHLTLAGINSVLDRDQGGSGIELLQFMRSKVEEAQHILVICNRTMMYKFHEDGFSGVCGEYLNYMGRLRRELKLKKMEHDSRFIIPISLTRESSVPELARNFADVPIHNNYLAHLLNLIDRIYVFGENHWVAIEAALVSEEKTFLCLDETHHISLKYRARSADPPGDVSQSATASLPPISSRVNPHLEAAKRSLQKYYADELKLQYLFYDLEPIPIEQAPQLVLVKEKEQKEKERNDLGEKKEADWRDERLASFEDLHNPKKPIELKKIFTLQDENSQLAKKFLIIGRAGIGKTVLSKFIATKNNELWGERFEWVFYISLRNLKESYGKRNKTGELKIDLAKTISCECFPDDESITEESVRYILSSDKVLLILDGYDELSSTILESALAEFLKYKYVILTSRPYALPNKYCHLYMQLENMGFSNEAISEYAEKFFTAVRHIDYTQPFLQFLRQNPAAWGIAHIPINLELICSLWEEKKTAHQEFVTPFTLTCLYQDIVQKLLRRYLMKRKINPVAACDLKDWVETRIYEETDYILEFLEQLAFRAIELPKSNIIIDNEKVIKPLVKKFTATHSVFKFGEVLDAQLLRSMGSSKVLFERDHYFIHLTFQEYFAARAIANQLKEICVSDTSPECAKDIRQFILKHRYNPRLLLVWQFVAGELAKDLKNLAALQNFFNILLAEPRDLLGVYERHLLVHCLAESGEPERLHWKNGLSLNRDQVLQSLLQLLVITNNCFIRGRAAVSRELHNLGTLAATPAVLDKLLLLLTLGDHYEGGGESKDIVSQLRSMGVVVATPPVLAKLIEALSNPNPQIQLNAISLLDELGTPAIIFAEGRTILDRLLALALKRWRNEGVEIIAGMIWAKWYAAAITPTTIAALLDGLLLMLRSEEENARYLAVCALGEVGQVAANHSGVLDGLLLMLRDSDHFVRFETIMTLGKIGKVAVRDDILSELLGMLRDALPYLKRTIINSLVDLGVSVITPVVLIELLMVLGTDWYGGGSSTHIDFRNKISAFVITPGVLEGLLVLLRDMNLETKDLALEALDEMGSFNVFTITPDVLERLLVFLRDMNVETKNFALKVLNKMGSFAIRDDILDELLVMLGGVNVEIKSLALEALDEMGSFAVRGDILDVLLVMLRDVNIKTKNFIVRNDLLNDFLKLRGLPTQDNVGTHYTIVHKFREIYKFAARLCEMGGFAIGYDIRRDSRDDIWSNILNNVSCLRKMGWFAARDHIEDDILDKLLVMAWDIGIQTKLTNILSKMKSSAARDDILNILLVMLQNVNVRMAVLTLAKMGNFAVRDDIVDELLVLLESENIEIKTDVASALGKMGVSAVLDELLVMLRDVNMETKRVALKLLSKIGSFAARDDVLDELLVLLLSKDIELISPAAAVLESLGAAGSARAPIFLEGLLTMSWHPNSFVVSGLVQLGSLSITPAVLNKLLLMIRDSDPKASSDPNAVYILRRIVTAPDVTTKIFFDLLPEDHTTVEILYIAVATALALRFVEQRTAFFCDKFTGALCYWERGVLQSYVLPHESRNFLIQEIRKAWVEYVHLPIGTLPPFDESLCYSDSALVRERSTLSLCDSLSSQGHFRLSCEARAVQDEENAVVDSGCKEKETAPGS